MVTLIMSIMALIVEIIVLLLIIMILCTCIYKMIATAIKEVKEIKWDSFLFEIDNHIKKWEKFQRNPDLLYNVDISELKALKNDAHSLMRQRYTKFKSYKRNSEWRKYEDRLESMVKGIDKVLGTKVGR